MNYVDICGTQLAVREFKGQRVVTLSDIDVMHHRPKGTAARNFNANKRRFQEQKDYYVAVVTGDAFIEKYGLHPQTRNNIIFITESGYLLLVKTLHDDLAWKVQERLVSAYFRQKQTAVELIDTPNGMVSVMQKQNELLSEQNEMLKDFCNTMLQSFQTLSQFLVNSYANNQQHEVVVENNSAAAESDDEEPYVFRDVDVQYKNQLKHILKQIVDLSNGRQFKSTGEVLLSLRKEVTRKYGVCWEQEAKEFKRQNGRLGRYIDIISAAPENRHYKSIILSMAKDMVANYGVKDTVKGNRMILPLVTNFDDLQTMLEKVCKRMGSQTPHGAALVLSIQSTMTKKYNYDFKRLKDEYRKKYHLSASQRVPVLKLLDEHENMKNDFIKELNEIIMSLNSEIE